MNKYFFYTLIFFYMAFDNINGFPLTLCQDRKKYRVGFDDVVGCVDYWGVTSCGNIHEFFNFTQDISNTCVNVLKSQFIDEVIELRNVRNFAMNSMEDKGVVLDCKLSTHDIYSNGGRGFKLINSTNINFYNMKIQNCGLKLETDLCKEFFDSVPVYSAFYIHYSRSITFENVIIEKSNGYSVLVKEVSSYLKLLNVTIRNNILVPFVYEGKQIKGYASGGGIYIGNFDEKFSSNTNIIVAGGLYENNIGETEDHQETCSIADKEFTFFYGRGGAFSMSLYENVNHINLSISNQTRFLNNTAALGGGINIKFTNTSHNNLIKLDDIFLTENSATYFGGGICVSSAHKIYNNYFELERIPIQANSAMLGGGLAIVGVDVTLNVSIHQCQIDNNAAFFGSGVYAKSSSLRIEDLMFARNNKNWKKEAIAHGALAVFESNVHIYGTSNSISYNYNTGLLLDQSNLFTHGILKLTKNKGIDGGGMAIYGNSIITVTKGSQLIFEENEASNCGGALYVDIPGPYIKPLKCYQMNRYICFINRTNGMHTNGGNLTFINNTASTGHGHSIFASTLQYCKDEWTNSTRDIFTSWNEFEFLPANNTRHVVTTAENIILKPQQWKPSPGFTFSPSITLSDERGNNVSQAVNVNPLPIQNHTFDVEISGSNQAFLVKEDQIHVAFSGQPSSRFDVEIVVSNSEVLPQNITDITMEECKFGFTLSDNRCVCDDEVNFHRSIAQCVGEDIYIANNHWIANKFSESSIACPFGYCKSCHVNETITGFECLLNISHQCADGRDQSSILCAKCLPGYSMQILNNSCVVCEGNAPNYVAALVALIYSLIFFILDIVLLYLNRETYANYMVSITFFYISIGTVLHSVSFPDPSGITFIVGDSESTGPGLCLINGLDSLQKLYFEYAMPLFVPFNFLVIYVIIQFNLYPSCMRKIFSWDAFYRSYSIATYYFWFGVVNVALKALQPIEIEGVWRVFVYAEAQYGDTEHLPLLIISLIMLTCFVLFMIGIVLASTSFYRYFRSHCFNITPLFESFKMGYVANNIKNQKYNDRTWFAIFHFIGYTILSLCTIYISSSIRETMISVVFLFFLIIVLLLMPYEEKWMNNFEIFIMSNLAVLTMLIDSMQGLYCPTTKDNEGTPLDISSSCSFVSTAIIILIYLPEAVIILYLNAAAPCIQMWRTKRLGYSTTVTVEDEYNFPYRPIQDLENENE